MTCSSDALACLRGTLDAIDEAGPERVRYREEFEFMVPPEARAPARAALGLQRSPQAGYHSRRSG